MSTYADTINVWIPLYTEKYLLLYKENYTHFLNTTTVWIMFKFVKQHDVKINVWFEYRSKKGGIFNPLYVPRVIA